MKRLACGLGLLAGLLGGNLSARATIVVDTVPVGNAGNAGQVQSQGTFGAVAVDYRIATYEVTNDQYVAFLNAVAADDPLGLYNASMGSLARGGITRSGVSGAFAYAAKPNMGAKPVNLVSWYDAARFANWLHNGQPVGAVGPGTTESGAYALEGGTAAPTNGLTLTREPGAAWFLPSEDEWYKAAYHKNDGATGNYFAYPASSDALPTQATANSVGDISNPGANVVNYNAGADWNSQNGNLTTVGSAGALSASPYLTFDQGGNAQEWNETLTAPGSRGLRGGSYANLGTLPATARGQGVPTTETENIGFRVAALAAVPEASAAWLLGAAALSAALARTQRQTA